MKLINQDLFSKFISIVIATTICVLILLISSTFIIFGSIIFFGVFGLTLIAHGICLNVFTSLESEPMDECFS